MLIVKANIADIASSNIPKIEKNMAQFEMNTTYLVDKEVQFKNNIYVCLNAENKDIKPDSNKLVWKRRRSTNFMRLFDLEQSIPTTNDKLIEYILNVSDVDSMAFFGVSAEYIEIELFVDSVSIYTNRKLTKVRDVSSWDEWTYEQAEDVETAIFLNIPMVYEAQIKISIVNNGGEVSVKHLPLGRAKSVGATLINPTVKVKNIIEDKRIDGGFESWKDRGYSKVTADVLIPTESVSMTKSRFEKHSDYPALYIADESEGGQEALTILAYFKDFTIPISLDKSVFKITLQGVTR